MSYCRLKQTIEEGDTVLIYLSPKQMYNVKIITNEVFQTRFGAIRLTELIGKPYGCKIQCSKGFVHILDMTPELWTLRLPHRTQILYGPDISLILMQLQLKSGSLVVEAGTGSGSLSHSIARTIAPNGKLFTFDFHEERVSAAKEEFSNHQIDSIVTVQHRDVCSDGFNVEQLVDAVFLDLPLPWEAINSAQKILKNGGRICCFSPCIEQVQKSCKQLSKLKFLDIETFECVLRPYEVKTISLKKIPNENSIKQASISNCESIKVKNENNDCCKRLRVEKDNEEEIDYLITYMNSEVAGHTGFLTFATNFKL